jgi:diguanylate cyclase (GGDEF)-like protein
MAETPDAPIEREQANALESLQAELRARETEIALLLETSCVIGSELDLDTVFRIIAEHARTLIKAETVVVPILSDDKKEYVYRGTAGANAEEMLGESLPIDYGLCGWVLRNQRPWWHGTLAELAAEERNLWEHEGGTIILVPLVGRHHFLGGLGGIGKQGGGDFTQRDFDLLQLFAAQTAIAIENAMTMEIAEQARREAEKYQIELQHLNRRMSAVNLQLEQMSLFDPLTGLPNRTLFRDRAQHEIEVTHLNNGSLAVLFIDLDKFQDINNSFGQETGDALLKSIARELAGTLGIGNTLSRVSGDEFAALVCNIDADVATALAHRMNGRLGRGIVAGNQHIKISASIGIAIYPEHGRDLSTLMKCADLAMGSAKLDHSGVHVFAADRDAAAESRFALIQNLHAALERQEFTLYYQPKLDLTSGLIASCEALARWPHPQRGMIPPDMFISALEQTNLILPFTRWVINTAAKQHAAWKKLGWDVEIAVNIPPAVLMNPEFIGMLDRDANGGGLSLEITENVFLGDLDRLGEVMNSIRNRGFTLSIDDFGTGYSSLRRLRQTPFSEIKIDRSFIKDMLTNKDDEVIVISTIELAHNLGLQVVGEGVEDAATLARLRELRCDIIQGYHLCRPQPPDQFAAFIATSQWPVRTIRPSNRHLAAV